MAAISPKARLLLDGAKAKNVDDFVSSLLFDEVCEAALVEYLIELGTVPSLEQSAANNWRREGAQRVLSVLKSIAKPPEAPPEKISSLLKQP